MGMVSTVVASWIHEARESLASSGEPRLAGDTSEQLPHRDLEQHSDGFLKSMR